MSYQIITSILSDYFLSYRAQIPTLLAARRCRFELRSCSQLAIIPGHNHKRLSLSLQWNRRFIVVILIGDLSLYRWSAPPDIADRSYIAARAQYLKLLLAQPLLLLQLLLRLTLKHPVQLYKGIMLLFLRIIVVLSLLE